MTQITGGHKSTTTAYTNVTTNPTGSFSWTLYATSGQAPFTQGPATVEVSYYDANYNFIDRVGTVQLTKV